MSEAGVKVHCVNGMVLTTAREIEIWFAAFDAGCKAGSSIPDGFALVPMVPSQAMIDAARHNGFEGEDDHVRSDWAAMLAAVSG